MNAISEALKGPSGVEEVTRPLIDFDDYPLDVQMAYHREHAGGVLWMRDKHPDAFDAFVRKYGQDFADEIVALAV